MLHYYGCTVSMKGFYFFLGHLSLQVSLCFPWSDISDLSVTISFLTFRNSHFSFSDSHIRFILYQRFSYMNINNGWVQVCSVLLFWVHSFIPWAYVHSFLAFNVKSFFILAPHLVSDSLILGTVLTQQILSSGSHIPDNIRSRACHLTVSSALPATQCAPAGHCAIQNTISMAFSQDVLLVFSLAYNVKPKQVPLPEISPNWSLLYHYCKVISQSDRWLIGKCNWCPQLFPGRVLLVTPSNIKKDWIPKVGVSASLEGVNNILNHSISWFSLLCLSHQYFPQHQSELSGKWSCLAPSPPCAR